jgi:hypothetical protein
MAKVCSLLTALQVENIGFRGYITVYFYIILHILLRLALFRHDNIRLEIGSEMNEIN